jgi:hypothetical protein
VAPTSAPPALTTAPPPGPQTISSASGVRWISCQEYVTSTSTPGGSGVPFTFRNQSSAGISIYYFPPGPYAPQQESVLDPGESYSPAVATKQEWMVDDNQGDCIEIFSVTSGGEVVVS